MTSTEPHETEHGTSQKLLFPHESYHIRGACFAVYKHFRNSQKEIIYQKALEKEMQLQGLTVEREKQLPVYYLEEKVGVYVPDFLVNNSIIIELKAKPFLHKDDVQQFWHYLKSSTFRLGFLINFGESNGVNIIRRVH
jgi:GxxExxY protein